MNTKALLFLTTKSSKLGFACACALLAGAGWGTKIGIDQLGNLQDELADDWSHPSTIYFWSEWQRTNSAAIRPSAFSSILPFPTNHAPPVLP